jgi:hypothetical protein
MSDHVYKKVELVGSSKIGVEDAIQKGIAHASKTLDHLNWFEVQEIRGHIENGEVDYYQVAMKVGFRLKD